MLAQEVNTPAILFMRDGMRVVTDSQIILTILEKKLSLLNIQVVILNQPELSCWLS